MVLSSTFMASSIFHRFLENARFNKRLVVQPRLGFGAVARMREALLAVRESGTNAIGTLTLDSYTRCGDYTSSLAALAAGQEINGFPILSYPAETTREMLSGILCEEFPIQVRHGTPLPSAIFGRLVDLGLNFTEGGPISYCMPYGRIPLRQATFEWFDASRLLVCESNSPHLETFGGCLMGQLCPPSLLIAVSILECIFFRSAGVRNVSLSYAQGTSLKQDCAALQVLRSRASIYLSGMNWHLVLYTYMGLFPATHRGADRLLRDSATLARSAGCERLIVKTRSERWRIPSIKDNVDALRIASAEAGKFESDVSRRSDAELIEEITIEVDAILNSVLSLSSDVGHAIVEAFRRGLIDIPFCVHLDNAQKARAFIDAEGCLRWLNTGNLAFGCRAKGKLSKLPTLTASELMFQLEYMASLYDNLEADVGAGGVPANSL